MDLRPAFRLIPIIGSARINALVTSHHKTHHVKMHRFQETIGGRAYAIEVTQVSNRWRAQLQRRPGMPTAMMPFYGQTPDEAAHLLAQWLILAHRRQAGATGA